MSGHIKVAGTWREITTPHIMVSGTQRTVTEGYVRIGGQWARWYPDEVEPDPPAPGTYVLAPESQYLPDTPGARGYAEFDTSAFQGYIDEIRARISWGYTANFSSTRSLRVGGRPSGTTYRSITDLASWSNRTIDHRIDTFSATSLTQFNNGTAIGFNLDPIDTSGSWSLFYVNGVQLVLTVT